tara:strand:- start:247249 stop:247896 length:648 start_codon:yes stop_codon:yes gene_type:complete
MAARISPDPGMPTVTFANRQLTPSKLVCVGRNYVAHIHELGNAIADEMVVFLKPNSALSQQLRATCEAETLHYEGEIAFLVEGGRLAGVGFALDLTRRALQSQLKSQGLPWERAKAFDGAAVCSDFVPLDMSIDDLSLTLHVDGELRQQGDVGMMLYPPETILESLQRWTTLEDGDLILTGTPAGVGPVLPGQQFRGCVLAAGRELVSASWTAGA